MSNKREQQSGDRWQRNEALFSELMDPAAVKPGAATGSTAEMQRWRETEAQALAA